jgi:spermidine synthase
MALSDLSLPRCKTVSSICLLAFLLSFCSLVYELLLASLVTKLAGDAIVWETVTIGVFIASLGCGLLLFSLRPPVGQTALLRRLVSVEFWLCLAGGLGSFVILGLHLCYRIYVYDLALLRDVLGHGTVVYFGMACQLVVILIGVLSGFEFPILYSLLQTRLKYPAGLVLFFYYLGAFSGTLVFSLVALPHLSLTTIGLLTAAINLLICFMIAFFSGDKNDGRLIIPCAAAALTLGVLYQIEPDVEQLHMRNYYYNKINWRLPLEGDIEMQYPHGLAGLTRYLQKFPAIERHVSSYHNIDIVEDHESTYHRGVPGSFSIFMDGRFQFSPASDYEYHEYLVHVPIMINQKIPRRTLILGGGDGLVARELLKYGELIDEITLIDMDQVILRLAREHPKIRSMNEDALSDPKVRVIAEDAFAVLQQRKLAPFDAVFIDFTYPFNYDSARLYSAEFFALVAHHLKADGFLAEATPIPFDDFDDVKELSFMQNMIAATLRHAGLHSPLMIKGPSANYLVARRNNFEYRMEYDAHGLTYRHLNPMFFHEGAFRTLKGGEDDNMVNSLFRPTFWGVEDTFF